MSAIFSTFWNPGVDNRRKYIPDGVLSARQVKLCAPVLRNPRCITSTSLPNILYTVSSTSADAFRVMVKFIDWLKGLGLGGDIVISKLPLEIE